jgi:GLPGLI family protein
MTRIHLKILLLFITTSIFAQKTPYFEAIYNISYNTDIPQTRNGQLQIDIEKKHTIFHIGKINNNIIESNPTITTSDYSLNYTIKHKDRERFIEINFNDRSIYSKETHRGKVYYIKDTVYNFNWNLDYSEQKKIGNLLCKKSTTNYRGRNYTAWYTMEIPLGYGPYKFQGLPGLIVSVRDDSGTFNWTLTSYKATTQKPQFKYNATLKPFMNVQEYYKEIRYPSDNKQQNIVQSRLPKGIKLISVSSDAHIRKGIETKFEWEEEKEKQ